MQTARAQETAGRQETPSPPSWTGRTSSETRPPGATGKDTGIRQKTILKNTCQKHNTALYLGSLLLLHYCKGYGFWVRLTARLSTRERWRGGRSDRRAATDKLERLVQDGQSVVAAVGHGGGRAYALAQAIPGVFHDAKRAQR